ncbi:TPA: 30S ribosome-binding factor RbfA [candidate division CPR2 bacterium]|uniref:Ribosome-binding factor A n=1 Tax=candidate division CPR2 bacterium GW2011_GWC1_41_48 TaxID=1618344 RepID=A0A0G0W9K7_UNCC2|nr:MAG: ribosome-binding factor A [candidate division CPR2 bacterium GW2011_GWC2_39_35]KKR29480.1 MAG: ribosome-binding factor A [candidate division CPR2 bacterium GW2011_GWD2_39_7]KKR29705.1 MAG: ribosome-binding factor A [candidate division CPR2 bacterium GW2011_GWD1_39_7]KKS09635.1 MAG: Ribosome-binding factor A [candidate division CPR2 bacterium GW2011_GWC1_41_48]OGB59490.1 MAG: ribosome-binding factor A [candidate division CPR2 bacterium GWD1_39_7]OGB71708.1 MAG: ribosome-binding factor A
MTDRHIKVQELIKEEISKLILREKIEGTILTVTGVDVSPDYKNATVWISVLGGNAEVSIKELSKKLPEFQSVINKRLSLKIVPKLTLREDHSAEYAEKIEKLFKKIKNEDD